MAQEPEIAVVILAAGQSTRMRSAQSKVLFPICGRPMIDYILDAVSGLHPKRIIVVVGHQGEQVSDKIAGGWAKENEAMGSLEFAWQQERLGTGHAVMCAQDYIPLKCEHVMVLCGDTPLVTVDLLKGLFNTHFSTEADLSLVTTLLEDPGDYGRIRRNKSGDVTGIVEVKEILPGDEHIKEINAGIYLVRKSVLTTLIADLDNHNAKGEFYLTDIVEKGAVRGYKISSFVTEDASSVQGVNDRYALSFARSHIQETLLYNLCLSGVTVQDIRNTYIDYGVKIGQDTVIMPGSFITGKTSIGSGCVIGPNTQIIDSSLGDNCKVQSSVVEESKLEANVIVGPFAHIRPNSVIKDGASIGNFAEIKNSQIGAGSKIHHHSYIGDSNVGSGVNIGAGTVTVNYDGLKKHRTVIEDCSFVGCNANLIAPVRIGKGSYVTAGSTITRDVPCGALGIARGRQVNKEKWVAKHKQRTD